MIKPLLEKIFHPGVSDLHLKAGEPPIVRQIGHLQNVGNQTLQQEDIESILNSILSEDQKAQLKKNGNLDLSHTVEGIGRLRVNVYQQRDTHALAIRIIPIEPKTFEELALPKETLEKLCRSQQGLILISGMTSTGKTTTLNAIINYINENFSHNIITVESPIEFSHPRKKSTVSQREIGRDVESFNEALQCILRQDPDIIVIGEMRTREAFQSAIEAAGSGHLVLGTMYSNDTTDVADRIVNTYDFNLQAYAKLQFTNALTAIIGQRLVMDKTGKRYLPATEILLGTSQIKKFILTGSVPEIRFQLEKGAAFGMHTFDQDLLHMFEQGLIGPVEALEASTNPNDLRTKLKPTPGAVPTKPLGH